MKFLKMSFWILIAISPSFLNADMNKKMQEFYDSFGSSSHADSASIYNGQRAGYATGGGVSIKNRLVDTQPLSINVPKFDAGCGGIDLYMGGFGFINSDEIVDTLKSVAQASKGYAFMLGLQTISPQIASTMEQMQSWANEINSRSINSCEVASGLTSAVWPRNTAAEQHICRTIQTKKGWANDFATSMRQCSVESDRNDQSKNAKSEYPDILVDDYNIAWESIQKQSSLSSDDQFAELIMTLMGTLIVSRSDDSPFRKTHASKISDESFLKSLLEGGTIDVYECVSHGNNADKKQCLLIRSVQRTIQKEESWKSKVEHRLIDIQNKVMSDTELTNQEIDFIAQSRLPLYKIINVLTAYKRGYCPTDLVQLADIIAMDMLIQYLRETTELVRQGCTALREAQFNSEGIDNYLIELSRIEKTIRYYENRDHQMWDREFQLLEKMRVIEEQLSAELSL